MDIKIKELLKEKRPNLSASSLKTYASILKGLYYTAFDTEDFDASKFDNTKRILQVLKDVNPRTRKTYCSALFVISDKPEYKKVMISDIEEYNDEEGKQEKTEKQEDNWVEKDDIINLFKSLEDDNKHIYKKKNISNSDFQHLQNYIILALLGGIYIPPRRSKDFVDFKIKDINPEEDNYLKGDKIYYNSYKTAKTYGLQIVEIPKELSKILKRWIKLNPTEYLLFDSNQNKLSNVKLNQRLNKLFGKKAGINQMRKTYMTDKYSETSKQLNEMAKDFKNMGSSTLQQKIYIKSN